MIVAHVSLVSECSNSILTDYAGTDKLVASMAKRLRKVIEEKGAMIDK